MNNEKYNNKRRMRNKGNGKQGRMKEKQVRKSEMTEKLDEKGKLGKVINWKWKNEGTGW